MANQKVLLCFALQLIFVISALHHTANAQAQGLKVGFYAHTCPKAEAIVTQIIHQTMAVAPSLGAPLMRMHFHDCFVRGCEDFTSRGLSVKDLAVLSGGHTIGTSHCSSFNNRLYNFSGKNDSDPTLDSEYVDRLKMKCKPADPITLVEMDPGSFKTFDVKYFDLVAKRRGLFTSDAALLDDSETKAYVVNHATASGTASFFKDFGVSMVNMGRVGVLTGSAGQIRKVCTKIN
ncbi:hypothetical protein F8388_008060 [Cannabis sativa]|uniref:peroxidase n=1 Tax=Cannabis sativa TaxID=3483 RepID=A0A7J6DXM3_CANSA|nr:hypothetical protein F8388_008060 [Cannabis sativa]